MINYESDFPDVVVIEQTNEKIALERPNTWLATPVFDSYGNHPYDRAEPLDHVFNPHGCYATSVYIPSHERETHHTPLELEYDNPVLENAKRILGVR